MSATATSSTVTETLDGFDALAVSVKAMILQSRDLGWDFGNGWDIEGDSRPADQLRFGRILEAAAWEVLEVLLGGSSPYDDDTILRRADDLTDLVAFARQREACAS